MAVNIIKLASTLKVFTCIDVQCVKPHLTTKYTNIPVLESSSQQVHKMLWPFHAPSRDSCFILMFMTLLFHAVIAHRVCIYNLNNFGSLS